MSDLFSVLSRYAFRQEENFLTESFVYLLNLILERENVIGLRILSRLCGEKSTAWFNSGSAISINTQLSVDEDRPDIIIHVDSDKIIFIEVKLDSSLGIEQLERYYSHLTRKNSQDIQLVLITRSRHSIQETTLDRSLFHHVCWYEISGWLSEIEIHDEVTSFVVEQFLDFLREKGMNMEKVSWEYIQGVPALINLVNMIGTAIAEVAPETSCRKTMGANWAGYYLDRMFIGFRYDKSLIVVIEDNNGTNPTFKRGLSLEKAHFFSLTAGEQLECLIEFVQKALQEYQNS